MSDDLPTQLLAAIAAKEAKARAATPSPWTLYDRGVGWEIPELPDWHDGLTFVRADAEYVADNEPAVVLAMCSAHREIVEDWQATIRNPYEGKTDDQLHQLGMHPDYEYRTTEGQRKAWRDADVPPEGEGWEENVTEDCPRAWERFEYTEESYWRRLLPEDKRHVWTPPKPPSYLVKLARGYSIQEDS